jgi:UDPglucose 6-dehydrogenase
MKITIAGYGFVGRGYEQLLASNRQNYSLAISDPALQEYSKGISRDTDAVVICVATPQQEDGACYMGNVFSVIEESPKDVPILIKSTICLEGWRELKNKFPNSNISFSPEFLRQESWSEDISNMESILIGGDDFKFWSNVFNNLKCVESEAEALIITKYAKNNFLALKVSFFNQLYDLCQKLGVNYDEVREHTTADHRIGDSHSFITEERGFGGHCFPKDSAALVKTSEKYGSFLSIMDCARAYNQSIRKRE